jgi:hypothetical protein
MNEWRIQYDAVLRLNLYTVGKTHQLLNRAVSEMRGLILGAADSGGNLTPLKLADIRRELDLSMDRAMGRWRNLTQSAQRESAAIPFGTMRATHRHYFGTVARGVAEALITEAGRRGNRASSRNANENADGVFDPQIAVVMKAANRDYRGGLSNKIWQTSQEARNGVNRVLFSGVQNGKSAYDIAKDLETYLGPGQDCPRWTRTRLYNRTKKQIAAGDRGGLITGNPCSSKGVAYKALRVARTEVQRVHNEATTRAMRDLPWVKEEQMNLSPAHPVEDICDEIIADGRDGKGIYPIGEIKLPIHPNCLCYMTAVDMDTDDFVDNLSSWVKGGTWEDMDRYAAKYGPGMDPPITAFQYSAPSMQSTDLATPEGVSNIDALDDWLGADEEVLDRRMGWDDWEDGIVNKDTFESRAARVFHGIRLLRG